MTRRDKLARKASDWMAHAREDLLAARGMLAMQPPLGRPAAFHAQQCAEMAIKSWLIHSGVEFPYTHDMRRLLMLCGSELWVNELSGAESLTRFATTARYGDVEPVATIEEATAAVALAESVFNQVFARLVSEGIVL